MSQTHAGYRVYGYRWLVLALYGLATVVIQLMWTTFFSITTEAWQFYGFADAQTGENAISMLSVIFMVGMIVLSVVGYFYGRHDCPFGADNGDF